LLIISNFNLKELFKMPYSWKAVAYGAVSAILTMVVLQYLVELIEYDVNQLVIGGIAGMVGAFVLGQINNKDKE